MDWDCNSKGKLGGSSIDILSMTHVNDRYYQQMLYDLINNPISADPNSEMIFQFTLQGFETWRKRIIGKSIDFLDDLFAFP